jgi:hypothetical protein
MIEGVVHFQFAIAIAEGAWNGQLSTADDGVPGPFWVTRILRKASVADVFDGPIARGTTRSSLGD